jgi:hypothetical protein
MSIADFMITVGTFEPSKYIIGFSSFVSENETIRTLCLDFKVENK